MISVTHRLGFQLKMQTYTCMCGKAVDACRIHNGIVTQCYTHLSNIASREMCSDHNHQGTSGLQSQGVMCLDCTMVLPLLICLMLTFAESASFVLDYVMIISPSELTLWIVGNTVVHVAGVGTGETVWSYCWSLVRWIWLSLTGITAFMFWFVKTLLRCE